MPSSRRKYANCGTKDGVVEFACGLVMADEGPQKASTGTRKALISVWREMLSLGVPEEKSVQARKRESIVQVPHKFSFYRVLHVCIGWRPSVGGRGEGGGRGVVV